MSWLPALFLKTSSPAIQHALVQKARKWVREGKEMGSEGKEMGSEGKEMKTLCLAVLLWTATAHGNCRFAIGETASPILDGLFDEWTDEDIVSHDPAGDHSAAFDLTFLSAKPPVRGSSFALILGKL